METNTKSQKNKIWYVCGAIYATVILFLLFIANLDAFNAFLASVLKVLRPVLIGLVLAYFCNPLFRLFERRLFLQVRPVRLRRALALVFTYLVVFLILIFFLLLLIPQLISSILSFVENYDVYMETVVGHINNFLASMNNGAGVTYLDANSIKESIAKFFASIDSEDIQKLLSMIDLNYVGNLIGGILAITIDVIFGFFISLYLLNTKEKRYAQVMRMRKAIFTDAVNKRITKFCDTANRSFGGFFRGKLLDSFIIGVLIYIAISIYGIQYPLLIATIIGITDIVPIIGPIIGVFPAGFIILLTQPEKLIPFIIIVILVQQLDGNIVSPKILGENTGISSLCVLIAITTMGTLWGFAGMILGVPLFATVLELSDTYLEKKLRAKGRSTLVEEPKSTEVKKTSKLFRRFEKKMLRLKQESFADGGLGDLTKFEELQLKAYTLAYKYNIFSGVTEESLAQLEAEEAAIAATVEPEITEEPLAQDDSSNSTPIQGE